MTHREKLQEQYEEAMFTLLMDTMAEQEGSTLLAEAERLNNDSNAAISEELYKKFQKIICDSFRKQLRSANRQTAIKVFQNS
jgi:hypothetical protein